MNPRLRRRQGLLSAPCSISMLSTSKLSSITGNTDSELLAGFVEAMQNHIKESYGSLVEYMKRIGIDEIKQQRMREKLGISGRGIL